VSIFVFLSSVWLVVESTGSGSSSSLAMVLEDSDDEREEEEDLAEDLEAAEEVTPQFLHARYLKRKLLKISEEEKELILRMSNDKHLYRRMAERFGKDNYYFDWCLYFFLSIAPSIFGHLEIKV